MTNHAAVLEVLGNSQINFEVKILNILYPSSISYQITLNDENSVDISNEKSHLNHTRKKTSPTGA
jgi:hypothetical protein